MSEDSVVAHVGGNPVAELPKDLHIPVSYTHLTLPTKA